MKNLFFAIAIALLASTAAYAQYDHNLQLNDGTTIIHSVTEIDSISFGTDAVPVMHLRLLNGNVQNFGLGLINQVIFQGSPAGSIASLDCAAAIITGTLTQGIAASGVSASTPYTGGNGGTYSGQTIESTGVSGLTATLATGTFGNGNGTLTFSITGTPQSSGTASFAINIGGQTCTLTIWAHVFVPFPSGTVHCIPGGTAVVEVVNPITGQLWMDRNLGASQAATSSTDEASYGDLYQWGRFSDGHQCRTSPTTSTISSSDSPGHGRFILSDSPNNWDWRNPQNNYLMQGVNEVNNPCPEGYRVPKDPELNAERLSWISNNRVGAFGSPLKLPAAGKRGGITGSLHQVGSSGHYWSSTVSGVGVGARDLGFSPSGAGMGDGSRAFGNSVRCLKNYL